MDLREEGLLSKENIRYVGGHLTSLRSSLKFLSVVFLSEKHFV